MQCCKNGVVMNKNPKLLATIHRKKVHDVQLEILKLNEVTSYLTPTE